MQTELPITNMNDLQVIQSKIYEIRGQRVMLDFDLAAAYGIETSQLKRQVRRNIERFEGDDFMFRLTKDEAVISSLFVMTSRKTGNRCSRRPGSLGSRYTVIRGKKSAVG